MREPEFIIKIAADSIERLRRVDVDRVIDDCSEEERKPMARYILKHHPDYAGAINAYWQDLLPLEVHAVPEDCIEGPGGLCVLCHAKLG